MGLSANTLFHFVWKCDYLMDILNRGFLPRYSLEDVSWRFSELINKNTETNPIGIPMVSFCDIKLTQTKHHTSKYGNFVIGMTKEWGIKNKITPVAYHHKEFLTSRLFAQAYKQLRETVMQLSGKTEDDLASQGIMKQLYDLPNHLPSHLFIMIIRLTALSHYHKPISTERIHNGRHEIFNFYDEREWRYIPDLTSAEKSEYLLGFLHKCEYEDDSFKTQEEEKLHNHVKLAFSEEDIKHIILPSRNYLTQFRTKFESSSIPFDYAAIYPKIKFYDEIEEDY